MGKKNSAVDPETTPAVDSETTPAVDSEVTPAVDSEVTPAVDSEVTPAANKAVKYRVTYLHGLNLRECPGGEIVRVLRYRSIVTSTGDMVEIGGTKWLPVEGGFVDSAYLNPQGE